LWEPEQGQAFASAKGEVALSADELAKGLIVHAPVTRWAALLIEPYQSGRDYGTPITPTAVQKAMAERNPALKAAVQRSAAYNP